MNLTTLFCILFQFKIHLLHDFHILHTSLLPQSNKFIFKKHQKFSILREKKEHTQKLFFFFVQHNGLLYIIFSLLLCYVVSHSQSHSRNTKFSFTELNTVCMCACVCVFFPSANQYERSCSDLLLYSIISYENINTYEHTL